MHKVFFFFGLPFLAQQNLYSQPFYNCSPGASTLTSLANNLSGTAAIAAAESKIYGSDKPDFFSLYFNLETKELIVTFSNDPEPSSVGVYNELEQVIKKQTVNAQVATLDMSALTKGAYSVRITNSNGTSCKTLIISK